MTTPVKASILTRDGREFKGKDPSDIDELSNNEAPYVIRLARLVGGLAEVRLPVGRADVVSVDTAFEVEPIGRWREGARQAYAYGAMSGLDAALAIYGGGDDAYFDVWRTVKRDMPGLAIWVFVDPDWRECDGDSSMFMDRLSTGRLRACTDLDLLYWFQEPDANERLEKILRLNAAIAREGRAAWDRNKGMSP